MGLSNALSKYKEQFKDKEAMAKLREKAKAKAEETIETAAVIGGGALGGYLGASYKGKTVLGVDYPLAGGVALTVAGLSGVAGKKWSPVMGALGEGMLAYVAGKKVEDTVK